MARKPAKKTSKSLSKKDLKKTKGGISSWQTSIGLQSSMSQMSQAQSLSSSIQKKSDQTAGGIIGNIRG